MLWSLLCAVFSAVEVADVVDVTVVGGAIPVVAAPVVAVPFVAQSSP